MRGKIQKLFPYRIQLVEKALIRRRSPNLDPRIKLTQRKFHIDFFLVGAAKSGTTAVSEWLAAHPSVYLAPIKETNYFSTDIEVNDFSPEYVQNTFLDLDNYFAREELPQVHISFIRREEHMNRLYRDATSGAILGECSTSHLYSLAAARNIHAHNDQAKIVIILRNPIDRAFSHYLMARKYGFTALEFREAIRKDLQAKKKGWGISELYVDLGMYSRQIQRYQELFPPGHMHIIKYDELLQSPERTFQTLCLFLGIPAIPLPKTKKANSAGLARMEHLNLWLTRSGLKKGMSGLFPSKMKESLKKFYYTDVNLPSLTEEDRRFMYDIFKDDIERTARITGLDLNSWMID